MDEVVRAVRDGREHRAVEQRRGNRVAYKITHNGIVVVVSSLNRADALLITCWRVDNDRAILNARQFVTLPDREGASYTFQSGHAAARNIQALWKVALMGDHLLTFGRNDGIRVFEVNDLLHPGADDPEFPFPVQVVSDHENPMIRSVIHWTNDSLIIGTGDRQAILLTWNQEQARLQRQPFGREGSDLQRFLRDERMQDLWLDGLAKVGTLVAVATARDTIGLFNEDGVLVDSLNVQSDGEVTPAAEDTYGPKLASNGQILVAARNHEFFVFDVRDAGNQGAAEPRTPFFVGNEPGDIRSLAVSQQAKDEVGFLVAFGRFGNNRNDGGVLMLGVNVDAQECEVLHQRLLPDIAQVTHVAFYEPTGGENARCVLRACGGANEPNRGKRTAVFRHVDLSTVDATTRLDEDTPAHGIGNDDPMSTAFRCFDSIGDRIIVAGDSSGQVHVIRLPEEQVV
jgi:hypothetical protein